MVMTQGSCSPATQSEKSDDRAVVLHLIVAMLNPPPVKNLTEGRAKKSQVRHQFEMRLWLDWQELVLQLLP
jgi:hypothetical protein